MNIDGNNLEIVVERKKIKNIYFRINENNEIYVTCPKYVTDREIIKLLNNNHDSLVRMYKKVKKRTTEKECVLYLGEKIDYVYHNRIIFDNDRIFAPSIKKANEYLEKKCLDVF